MSKSPITISELLSATLDEKGYSVRKLAELTSIDKATISRIMNGKRKPTLLHLKKLSAALELPFSGLVETLSQEVGVKEKAVKKTKIENHKTKEIDLLEKSLHMHDQSITADSIFEELKKCEEYAETDEGNMMMKEAFEGKVLHFGNTGPYIQKLKLWHQKLLLSQGSKRELVIMGGALIYFILPLDLLHDYVFAVGYLDDCIAIQLAGNRLESKV